MLRKVKLYGELADFVGYKELDAVINSTADAMRFLVSNFPKLESHMADRYYKVLVDDYDIDETELHNPIGQSDISIVPVISGAGGARKLLLGAVLIGVGVLSGGATFVGGSFTGVGFLGGVTAIAGNVGIGLVLQGVSDLLYSKPKDVVNEEDPRISFSFSGVQNTSRAGTSHPIVYGEIVTGSVVISAGIDTNQVST